MSSATEKPPDASELPPTAPADAGLVTTAQLERLGEELAGLDLADWHRATDCTGWTVHDVVAHVVGTMAEARNPVVMARHSATAYTRYRKLAWLDGLNEAQIDDRRFLEPGKLLSELTALIAPSVRGRSRTPGLLRRLPAGGGLPRGSTLGYLHDVIAARDAWMHRVDVARATGHRLTPEPADAQVVAQVVRDLARNWRGPSFVLRLTGATAGRWAVGHPLVADRPDVTLDAVVLCRSLSGRPVPSATFQGLESEIGAALEEARVAF